MKKAEAMKMQHKPLKQLRITLNPLAPYFNKVAALNAYERRMVVDRAFTAFFSENPLQSNPPCQRPGTLDEATELSPTDNSVDNAHGKNHGLRDEKQRQIQTAEAEKTEPVVSTTSSFKLPKGALAIASASWS